MAERRLGPYRLLAELGTGGMGRVWRAEVVEPSVGLAEGSFVAVKVIHPHLLERPGFFKRFLREAEIGRAVQHANVVRCFDCDSLVVDGARQDFLVMELVEGQTLRALLEELGAVPEKLCRHIGGEIAKGLTAIHAAGVVHRDLKPENVLITPAYAVKVMDLGVARLRDEAIRLSQSGVFVGSLEYAAPEQFRGSDQEVDARSDLHALGAILYELAAGEHPYRDDDAQVVLRRVLEEAPRPLGESNPQISPFYEEVVGRLLAKSADERFASADDVRRVLEEGEQSAWWRNRAKVLRLETRRPLRRMRIPRETSLYGRAAELERLEALFGRVRAGEGQTVLIEGEAGIGKTRLVDEFVGRLQQAGEDVNFLFGSYPPGGAATAAGAFSTAYREHFGAEGLTTVLPRYLEATPLLVPAFAALLTGDIVPTGREPLTKDSLQTVFVHATRALAAERPTIVLIDDLHFAPEEGRALFASLALATPGHRILLLGTLRPGLPEDWVANVVRQENATSLPLTRLGPKDLGQLLIDAFRSERLATELGLQIATKSDGNPFFAFEIIRGLREGKYITQSPDGTWITTQVIRNIQVPSTVLDLVKARVADLTEEERELLDVASCCGFLFDPLVVGSALGQPGIPTLKRLAQMERKHRLVRALGSHYVFDHHQVQEALYGSLADPLREAYHAALAQALEARTAEEEPPDALDGALCVDLCDHFLRGAQGPRALRYLDGALKHLAQGYLNGQAVELADRILAVDGLLAGTERARILMRKQSRLHLLGDREAEAAALDEAQALAEAAGEPRLLLEIENARVRRFMTLGAFPDAIEAGARALERAQLLGDRAEEAMAAANLGLALRRVGRYEESFAQVRHCRAIARELENENAELMAASVLGGHHLREGRHEAARREFERSLELARSLGDRQAESFAHGNLGNLCLAEGRYDDAARHHARWHAIASEIGDRQGTAAATGNLGVVALRRGDYETAARHFEEHRSLSHEMADRQGEVNALANLALIEEAQGHLGEARELNERALTLARSGLMRRSEGLIAGNLGGTLRALGQLAEARGILDRAVETSRTLGDPRGTAHALGELAAVALCEGKLEEAAQLAQEARLAEAEIGSKERLIEILTTQGAIEVERGREDAAAEHFEAACGLADRVGDPDAAALARASRALLPDGGGAAALAPLEPLLDRGSVPSRLELRWIFWKATRDAEHLREAKRLLDEICDHAPDDCRATVIENVLTHREIDAAWRARQER